MAISTEQNSYFVSVSDIHDENQTNLIITYGSNNDNIRVLLGRDDGIFLRVINFLVVVSYS
jgi:hypothetical protein